MSPLITFRYAHRYLDTLSCQVVQYVRSKRGELRRLAATKNKQLNSTAGPTGRTENFSQY